MKTRCNDIYLKAECLKAVCLIFVLLLNPIFFSQFFLSWWLKQFQEKISDHCISLFFFPGQGIKYCPLYTVFYNFYLNWKQNQVKQLSFPFGSVLYLPQNTKDGTYIFMLVNSAKARFSFSLLVCPYQTKEKRRSLTHQFKIQQFHFTFFSIDAVIYFCVT